MTYMNSLTSARPDALSSRTEGPTRGVALLIVITILVTMVLVALPFALSMRQGQERTRSIEARARAQFEASLMAEILKLHLNSTHPFQEQKRYDQGERGVEAQPGVDSREELIPNESFRAKLETEILDQWAKDPAMAGRGAYLKSRGLGPLNDDRGSIWTAQVQDAQALVNVNGASPFLLGNLFGAATLADDLDTGGGDISIENLVTGRFGGLRGFPREYGHVRIGREVISYEEFDGETFRGCERARFQDTPLGDNGSAEAHEKGTPVIDYTAYKLATHLIARRPGNLTPFRNLEALREIASWGEGGVLSADRLENLLSHLTVWSRRETSGSWLANQLVMNKLPESLDGGEPDEVQLRDIQRNPSGTTAYLSPGVIVRVNNGVDTVYQVVDKIGDEGGRRRANFVVLAGPTNATRDDVEFKGGETTISAYAPYPININTASRTVLYAVMANLQFYSAKDKDKIVTPDLAWSLAGEIVTARKGAMRADGDSGRRLGGPFRHAADFGRFLEDRVRSSALTRGQSRALYTNAINPHSYLLRFGTAPWCYRSLDVYHIEARVALNNRAGDQIAEASLREVVEIGSDTTASWTLDSQQDFEERIAMGSGAKWVTTYPYGVAYKDQRTAYIQPALRAPKGYIDHVYPSDVRGGDLGDVRLEPARIELPGAQVVEHFDSSWYADGHFSGYDGAYTRPVNDTWKRKGDDFIRPFSMSFWWRPYSDSDWTAFDAGVEQYRNRIGLFVQSGDEGQELTFRVCAGNLWAQGAEVYVPMDQLDFQPGNWYHLHVSCAGEDPSTMQLLVDGVDIGKRRGFTTTVGSVSTDGTEIAVDDTSGFPVRGAIRIGSEIIEYDTLAPTSFRDCLRGARGTTALDFPSSVPVHMVGYSMPLTVPVMTGGASLSGGLNRWTALRVTTMDAGEAAPDTTTVLIDGVVTPIVLKGFGEDRKDITVTTVAIWGQDDADAADAFGDEGIALLGCPRISGASSGGSGPASPEDPPQSGGDGGGSGHDTPGDGVPPGLRDPTPGDGGSEVPLPAPPSSGDDSGSGDDDVLAGGDGGKLGGWEVVYYQRQGNTFTIERYIKTAWQGAAEPYFLITEVVTDMSEWPAFLVPISVLGTGSSGNDDYLDPSVPADLDALMKYYPQGDQSARVLLGTDTPLDAYEVIRYDSIDRNRSAGILFVRDRNIGGITALFFGDSQEITGGSSTDGDDPTDPVPDPEPDDPPPPVPPGDDGGNPGGGTDPGGGDPAPGDGVPPGMRDPGDDPGDDSGGDDGGDPGDGGGDEPGTGDGDSDGGAVGGGGDGEDDEPLGDDGSEEEEDNADQGAGDGTDDPGDQNDEGATSGSDSGSDGGAGERPPPEEPSPDSSGGGGDSGTPGGPEEEYGNAAVPDQPQPTLPDEGDDDGTDENGNVEGTGDVWEPLGPGFARLLLPFRGVNGTYDQDHTAGGAENARFLPCFRTYEASRGWPVQRTGRNDVITFHSGIEGSDRVQMGIRWGDESSSWVALDDFIDIRFDPDKSGALKRRNDPRGHARVMKFPCGEMPDEMGAEIEFGQSQISGSGLVTAFLDELHVWRHTLDTSLVIINTEGIGAEAEEIAIATGGTTQLLTTLDGYSTKCGVALIEGEIVIYRGSHIEGANTIVLERCARGQLGTRATFHAWGGSVRFLPDIPVSYLDGGMSTDSSTVPMGNTDGWPQEGLARIVRDDTAELIHFTRRGEAQLIMPVSLDANERSRDRGLFRGRFGTDAVDHDSNEIVVYQPFRYWDRFAARRSEDQEGFSGVHEHPETSFFAFGKRVRSGVWNGFTWTENLLGRNTGRMGGGGEEDGEDGSSHLDIYVLGRFNPTVPWDTDQVVDLRGDVALGRKVDLSKRINDHLFLFDGAGDSVIGNGNLGNRLGIESDTAEFRIYMVYETGAFEPVDGRQSSGSGGDRPILSNLWKATPWLKSFSLNYFSRTVSRYRSVVR